MKCKIDRQNRNRRGGHKTQMASNHRFSNEVGGCTPVEKSMIKRLSRKKVRRQWQASHNQINHELLNDWTWQDERREIELEDDWEYNEEHDVWEDYQQEEGHLEEALYDDFGLFDDGYYYSSFNNFDFDDDLSLFKD